MRIEELTLGDFGCFYDERLSGLGPGLTVVAGPQRAGKTTLMEAVRHLGYGIGRGEELPPAADRYDLRATVVQDGNRYGLEVDNYAEPTVTPIDGGPERTARELFGDVREEQYRQLYTISLDELRRTPAALADGADISRILLGAGFGTVSRLPDLIEDLGDRAADIGRTTGLRGGPIKEAIETIETGIEHRDEALEQVETHDRTRSERAEVVARIEEIEGTLEDRRRTRLRLDVCRELAADYERLCELERSIDPADREALEAFPLERLEWVRARAETDEESRATLREERGEFASAVSVEDPRAYRERLLERSREIREHDRELARYEAECERLGEEADALEADRAALRDRIAGLNPAWDGLADVRDLETDVLATGAVREAVETHERAAERLEDLDGEIDRLAGQTERLEERIEAATGGPSSLTGVAPWLVAGTVVALGLGWAAARVDPLLAVAVTAGALVATVVALLVRTGTLADDGVSVEQLRGRRETRVAELAAARDRREAAAEALEDARNRLQSVGEAYDLPAGTDPATLGRFYEELQAVTEDIADLDARAESLADDRAALAADLRAAATPLVAVGLLEAVPDDPLADPAPILTAIETAAAHLELATEVAATEETIRDLEAELAGVLERWEPLDVPPPGDPAFPDAIARFIDRGAELAAVDEDREERAAIEDRLRGRLEQDRIEAAFDPVRPDGAGPIEALGAVYGRYGSADAIEDRLETVETELSELADEREVAIEQRVTLDERLETLKSDENVHEAHERIQAGRRTLEDRLERYAHHRIAEHLLAELHERYLERTTGPLLERASEIFSRITDGTYEAVVATEAFEDLDFVARRADGDGKSSGRLSRATAEQLFLSVRLAKIQLADEPLPVLLDDSLTNFDPGHARRTLEVVGELAADHQVLLLTCHPPMIERVEGLGDVAYWSLEGGRLEGPSDGPEVALETLRRAAPSPSPE